LKVSIQEAHEIRARAKEIHSPAAVTAAIDRVGREIAGRLADTCPLVLCVMTGGVVFTGQLLPKLEFPLDFDYLHVTRYAQETSGGALSWRAAPWTDVKGRTILVVDDVLDEGHTLAAVKQRLLQMGAREVLLAVLVDKQRAAPKPVTADFVALTAPDQYLFGGGMDVKGAWRQLQGIYACAD
jgi:hypoxanthine phosphoribosyltransferase